MVDEDTRLAELEEEQRLEETASPDGPSPTKGHAASARTGSRARLWLILGLTGLLLIAVLALTIFAPRGRLLAGERDEVRVYLSPSDYKPGEIVTLIIEITQQDADRTAIRQVTLGPERGEPLLETAEFFHDAPWGEMIYGEDAQCVEEYEFLLPPGPRKPLPCTLIVDYVEGRTVAPDKFENRPVLAEIPITLFASDPAGR